MSVPSLSCDKKSIKIGWSDIWPFNSIVFDVNPSSIVKVLFTRNLSPVMSVAAKSKAPKSTSFVASI